MFLQGSKDKANEKPFMRKMYFMAISKIRNFMTFIIRLEIDNILKAYIIV